MVEHENWKDKLVFFSIIFHFYYRIRCKLLLLKEHCIEPLSILIKREKLFYPFLLYKEFIISNTAIASNLSPSDLHCSAGLFNIRHFLLHVGSSKKKTPTVFPFSVVVIVWVTDGRTCLGLQWDWTATSENITSCDVSRVHIVLFLEQPEVGILPNKAPME